MWPGVRHEITLCKLWWFPKQTPKLIQANFFRQISSMKHLCLQYNIGSWDVAACASYITGIIRTQCENEQFQAPRSLQTTDHPIRSVLSKYLYKWRQENLHAKQQHIFCGISAKLNILQFKQMMSTCEKWSVSHSVSSVQEISSTNTAWRITTFPLQASIWSDIVQTWRVMWLNQTHSWVRKRHYIIFLIRPLLVTPNFGYPDVVSDVSVAKLLCILMQKKKKIGSYIISIKGQLI